MTTKEAKVEMLNRQLEFERQVNRLLRERMKMLEEEVLLKRKSFKSLYETSMENINKILEN